MNKMHIGLSTSTIEHVLTQGRADGIGVYTGALMRGLPAAGCEVRGFSFYPTAKSAIAEQFSSGSAMPSSYAMMTLRDLLMPRFVKTRLPIDLYHATDYRIPRIACPVVATLHDAIPLKYPEWCSPRLRGLKNWLQKNATRNADHVIALSHYAVAELVEFFGIREERITVIHCGVGSEWKQVPTESDVDASLRVHGLERGYFLFVGTLQPRKNVERIIDAYLGLPADVRRARQLVIVGRVGWRCEDALNKMKAAIQRGEKIVWLNNLVGEEPLRRIYAGAGVFVFPSLYEGFGIPVAEAFACGVPVVTSNTTSLPEVSQGAALEIDPLSITDIGEAMLSMARDNTLRERSIAAGHARVAQLTWERTAAQTAEVYHSVLGR